MRNRLSRLNLYLWLFGLAGSLLGVTHNIYAGALNGIDDPDRVPGEFMVVLKRERIVSLKNPVLSDRHERAVRSPQWQAARAAVATELAQFVDKLTKAHPHIRISASSAPEAVQTLTMKASDEDAKAVAGEPDVAEVDANMVLRNTTLTSPAPSWGLERIDQLPSAVTPSTWVNAYSWIATGAGVDAFILDSGIMTTNVDFGGRATNDADFVFDGQPGWCASTVTAAAGHGTEVASIVGGTTYGVAKQVRLHSVRVVDCDNNSSTGSILQGLEWIYNNISGKNAVLNISLQWIAGTLNSATLPPSKRTFVTDSFSYLQSISIANVPLIIAAGNGGAGDDPINSWPQAYNSYVTVVAMPAFIVGATAYKSDNIWSGTSLGSTAGGDALPNIFAPGDEVTTAWITSTTATTSAYSGTSLAAPYVTGVMALAAGVGAGNDLGCDFSIWCVVDQTAYYGVIKGNLQGALNYEVSSLVPGNDAPASLTSTTTPETGAPPASPVTTIVDIAAKTLTPILQYFNP